MRESVSGATSHMCTSERAMKLKVCMINHYHHSTKLYRKNITHLCTRDNTDGNKLMIFSGIALYYGDTYIIPDNRYSTQTPVAATKHTWQGRVYHIPCWALCPIMTTYNGIFVVTL